jgi:hypothetical protein
MLNRTQASKRNVTARQGRRSSIEFESADLKCTSMVRMFAYFFLSISVTRRCGEWMFSYLAHKGANGNCEAAPTFYGPLQEARFVMVHRRSYINKALWTMPCVVASIVHTLQPGIIRSECP